MKPEGFPIPNPNSGESREKFIARCMSNLKGEFPDRLQRYAICIQSFENKYSKNIGKKWK